MFPVKRQAGWWLIALVVAGEGTILLGWSWIVQHPALADLLDALRVASGGLIGPNLVLGLLALLLVVVVCMFVAGGMPAAALGWSARKVGPAFLVGVGLWVALQLVLGVVSLIGGHGLALAPGWRAGAPGYVFGGLLAQVFAIALREETVFRGFLFPQLAAKLPRLTRARALVVGALISQLLFALGQVGNILLFQEGRGPGIVVDVLGLFLLGLWLATFYLVTENLFVCVVVHALLNQPVVLVQADPATTQIVLYALTLLLLSAWGPLEDQLGGQPLVVVEEPEPEPEPEPMLVHH